MQKHANYTHHKYDAHFMPLPVEPSEPVYFSGILTELPYADDFPFLHYHDRYEIGICDEGEGLFLSEGGYSSVSKGDLIFIGPSRRHYSRSLSQENPCVCRFAYFRIETVEQLISLSASENKMKNDFITCHAQNIPPVIHPSENPMAAESLQRIMKICAQKTAEGNMVASLLFASFIIEAQVLFQPFLSPYTMSKTDDAVSEISEYLSLHYSDSDSSRILAQKCHLSESQLRRRFLAVYGIPPIAYRNFLRCRIAAELLTKTTMPVSEISSRIGFHATSDFYRAFRKIYDSSPSCYRSSHR